MEKMFLRAFLCVPFAFTPYAQYLPSFDSQSIEEQISQMEGNAVHTAAKPPAVKIAGASLRDRLPLYQYLAAFYRSFKEVSQNYV